MKRTLLLVLCAAFALASCVSTGIAPPPKPQEIVVKVEGPGTVKETAEKVSRTMQVPYEEPQWPAQASAIGDTVYYTLWGGINTVEALNVWKTVQVAQHRKLSKLYIYINSGGGNAFDGLAISDMLLRASAEGISVTTEASGIVASAAVPIFAVGQHRMASEGTVFMIHQGKLFKFVAEEGRDDLLAQQKMMELEESRYNRLLEKHSNLSLEQIEKMCAKTTWFTAAQAKEWKLVDEIK